MNGDGSGGSSLGARALGGLGWAYLGAFCKSLLSLLALVILARLLTPVDYGLLAIAWIFIVLGARFGQAVVGPAIVQREDLTSRHIQAGFALALAVGIALAVAAWLVAPVIAAFFNEPALARVVKTLALIFLIDGVSIVPISLLRRRLDFKRLALADVLAYSLGYGCTAVVLASQGFGVWSLVWGEIMHRVIYTVTVIRSSRPAPRPRWSRREAAELLSRGIGFSLARVFEFIARLGGHFVIGRWLGAASLGYYTRADRLVLLPRNYANQGLFQVLFPAMARRQQGTERLADVYLHGLEALALAALAVSALVFVAAPEIVAVILGGQWGPVALLLRILAFAILFQVCDILNLAIIGALGAVYRQAWRQGAHAFLVIGGAWFASGWGLREVVMVLVGAQIIAYLLMTQLATSLLEIRRRALLRRYLPALWTGAWAAIALWLTAGQLRAMDLPAGLALFIEIAVWIVAILAALYYAPPFTRALSIPWALKNVSFEVLGAPGMYLRKVLEWLARG